MPDTFRETMDDADQIIWDALGDTWIIDGRSVTVTFDNAYEEIDEVAGTYPILSIRDCDAEFVTIGSQATDGCNSYKVVAPMPQNDGDSRFLLERIG